MIIKIREVSKSVVIEGTGMHVVRLNIRSVFKWTNQRVFTAMKDWNILTYLTKSWRKRSKYPDILLENSHVKTILKSPFEVLKWSERDKRKKEMFFLRENGLISWQSDTFKNKIPFYPDFKLFCPFFSKYSDNPDKSCLDTLESLIHDIHIQPTITISVLISMCTNSRK